jgi:outer membrane murein-binding lipoprotein Lpp
LSRSLAVTAVGATAALTMLVAGCHSSAKSSATASISSHTPAALPNLESNSPDAPTSPAAATPVSSAGSPSARPASSPVSPAVSAISGSGGGTLDVCSLMSAAQASSINGVTYGAGTPHHIENGWDICEYKNNGSVDPVDIQPLTTEVLSVPNCYSLLEDADGAGPAVSGVGTEAFGYSIGLVAEFGSRCVGVSGLTDAELHDRYGPDAAMAKVISTRLG